MEKPDISDPRPDDHDGSTGPKINLAGVPETALLTLYNRASEAARPDALLTDPVAVTVAKSVDYPFADRFGKPDLSHPLRAKQFDTEVLSFLASHDGAVVVALGEGLETQLWRAGNGCRRWISVDLPEMIRLRRRLLPHDDRNVLDPHSAWDLRWVDSIPPESVTMIIAQGLMMYFTEDEVIKLLCALGAACPGAVLVFDTIPAWAATSQRGRRGAGGYRLPAQPWGTGRRSLDRLLHRCGIRRYHLAPMPAGRGIFWGHVYPTVSRIAPGVLPMTVVASLPR